MTALIVRCRDCKHLVEQFDDDYGPALPWTYKCDKGHGYRVGSEYSCEDFEEETKK